MRGAGLLQWRPAAPVQTPPMTVTDTASLAGIRAHHLFAGLAPPQLQRLLATAHIDDAESGQVLFDRGQPAKHFYVVVEGQVNLVLYSKTGEEKIVDILGPGQSFAEAVMFMSGPVYPVSAVAAAPSRIARFSSVDYVSMLRESPETCLRMLGHLSQRLHMRIREIEYLTLESATHRLVRMIEGRLPAGTDGPTEVQLQESRQEIASRLSMKPETLSRILRHLSDNGSIVVHGRSLVVPSRARLLSILDAQG
jgi:CRP/FNR family transcriptional regulator, dissimilatory nitrate respiration regulator